MFNVCDEWIAGEPVHRQSQSMQTNGNREGLERLQAATDARERNRLAIQLADEKAPGLADVLVELIHRPELENQRGTLVYSLGIAGASDHVPLLCDLVLKGNFEVAHEALSILENVSSIEGLEVEEAARRVRAALRSAALEDWRRKLVADLEQAFE